MRLVWKTPMIWSTVLLKNVVSYTQYIRQDCCSFSINVNPINLCSGNLTSTLTLSVSLSCLKMAKVYLFQLILWLSLSLALQKLQIVWLHTQICLITYQNVISGNPSSWLVTVIRLHWKLSLIHWTFPCSCLVTSHCTKSCFLNCWYQLID